MQNQLLMTADDTVGLIRLIENHHIEVIIDGGWAVDALLGRQTRLHEDLDIAMPHKYVPQLRELLESRGYQEVPLPDSWECNFVMDDEQGHRVDIHTYTFDEHGKLVFGLPYPPDSLNGQGVINGYAVRCITPGWLIRFHSGYQLDENDYHDVQALCQQFGFEISTIINGLVT
jgi:lincosamide nucleotidyltransferase A/C/D/E